MPFSFDFDTGLIFANVGDLGELEELLYPASLKVGVTDLSHVPTNILFYLFTTTSNRLPV
jgi:hypothetical protein